MGLFLVTIGIFQRMLIRFNTIIRHTITRIPREQIANGVKHSVYCFFEMSAVWNELIQNPNIFLVIASYIVFTPPEHTIVPVSTSCRIFTSALFQKDCGACAAFAVSTLVAMQSCLYNNEDFIPSPFRIFDCTNGTCDSGSRITTAAAVVNYGISDIGASEHRYGLSCNMQSEYKHTPIHVTHTSMTTPGQIKTSILYFGPVIGFIGNPMLRHPDTGVYHSISGQPPSERHHAVVVLGWDKDGNWIIQNSWGEHWGSGKGRGLISQQVLLYAADPTIATTSRFCVFWIVLCLCCLCTISAFEKEETRPRSMV
jgi:hypothetical protein